MLAVGRKLVARETCPLAMPTPQPPVNVAATASWPTGRQMRPVVSGPSRASNLRDNRAYAVINFLGPWMLVCAVACQSTISELVESGNDDWLAKADFPKVPEAGGMQPFALAFSNSNEEKPRLIPLVAAESGYSENSSVNLLCTVSQGHHGSLTFDWFKDGQLLASNSNLESHSAVIANRAESSETIGRSDTNLASAPQIEKNSDHSLLRISRVQAQHSGRYTCAARNQFGQDSSSVNLIVNGNYSAKSIHPSLKSATLCTGRMRRAPRAASIALSAPIITPGL